MLLSVLYLRSIVSRGSRQGKQISTAWKRSKKLAVVRVRGSSSHPARRVFSSSRSVKREYVEIERNRNSSIATVRGEVVTRRSNRGSLKFLCSSTRLFPFSLPTLLAGVTLNLRTPDTVRRFERAHTRDLTTTGGLTDTLLSVVRPRERESRSCLGWLIHRPKGLPTHPLCGATEEAGRHPRNYIDPQPLFAARSSPPVATHTTTSQATAP